MERTKKEKIIIIVTSLLAVVLLFLTLSPFISEDLPCAADVFSFFGIDPSGGKRDELIAFIDVGQGDCTLVMSGENAVLIDCGTPTDDGIQLIRALRKLGVTRLDRIFLTHPHSDHIGGAEAVIKTFEVGGLCLPDYTPSSSDEAVLYTNILALAESQSIPLTYHKTGDIYKADNFTVETVMYDPTMSDENDRSAIFKVSMKGYCALITGDAGEAVERAFISSGADLSCDILKVGHHGSKTSSSAGFLKAVSPGFAVISVGENSFGHPSEEVTGRLHAENISIYRTDVNGSVIFRFDNGISVETEY